MGTMYLDPVVRDVTKNPQRLISGWRIAITYNYEQGHLSFRLTFDDFEKAAAHFGIDGDCLIHICSATNMLKIRGLMHLNGKSILEEQEYHLEFDKFDYPLAMLMLSFAMHSGESNAFIHDACGRGL